MNIKDYMREMGQTARLASYHMAKASTRDKNQALSLLANAIREQRDAILQANREDMAAAEAAGLPAAFLDRLLLSESAIANMASGVEQIASLPDPIGEMDDFKYRPSGIAVGRMRVPLGVIGIIYEARPNVTIDAAALCLKSGNAAILRGGSEAIRANRLLAKLIADSLQQAGLPASSVQFVDTTDRAAVGEMITLREFIDVIVPRGGRGLIERLLKEARVPMIQHLEGNCHIYVDESADLDKAVRIVDNAKTQRYGTCNTTETLLVAAAVADSHLPAIAQVLLAKGVQIRGCPATCQRIRDAVPACEEDYRQEFLAPILAVKVVADLDAAIEHINRYASGHTEAIISENYSHIMRFLREIDSSSVMANASTRFADGFEYGLGAEIGISTDKIHARGPVGLEGLTSQKWLVLGHGEVRQ